MTRNGRIVGKVLGALLFGTVGLACYARATVGPTEECRTVEVRSRHDVEECHARCNDDGCRAHCSERERWSREHHCWAE